MSQQQGLSEQERRAFMDRLGQFRQTLPEREQQMLDGMVLAAFTPQNQGEVQGYDWIWTGTNYVWRQPVPAWYTTVPVYAPVQVLPVAPYWTTIFYP